LSAESPTLPSIAASPFTDIIRLYRRICLLRANGQADAATLLESTEFSAAMESIHAHGDANSVAPLLAAEDARIADAVALAEVLAPLLASRLAAVQGAVPPAVSSRTKPVRREPVVPGGASPSPTVADFIDGMLAQDRADSRPN
jgi:hypothetical protein